MAAINMMQATPYPAQAGMGPGHPGMPHGHPMQVQHGHMGQPNPAMMAGMHPGMSGPQVTQGGPMATGMPPNPGTPAPGGPMGNALAMGHLGGQGHMFNGNPQQMNMGHIMNANALAQRRALINQQMQGQLNHGMVNMQNMQGLTPAQMQQVKMANMPMPQQMQHMTAQQQMQMHQAQQFQHQQRMLAQHQHQQSQMMQQRQQHAQQQAQQQQQQQQQHASQQMQLTRSQEPTTQPPPPQPTPAPQVQPPSQPQPTPSAQPQQQTPQQKPQQPQPPTTQPQQQNAPTPQIKQPDDEDAQTKPDIKQQQMLMDMPGPSQDFSGQCILQLLSYYDTLAYPARPNDIMYWREQMERYYSPMASIRQQIFNPKNNSDKSFQLRYESLPRFYHSHFINGVRKIFMQSFDHVQEPLPNGGHHVVSKKLYVTYEYNDGLRITMNGQLSVNFDEMQKIEHLYVATKGWTEYIPRHLAEGPQSPEITRQSPKLNKKNLPKNMQLRQSLIPRSPVNQWGIPEPLVQFLEIAEVLNAMGPLMDYCLDNDAITRPREGLQRYNQDCVAKAAQMQNMNAAAANGQVPMSNQRISGMNPPNQFQSPSYAHLNLPQNQHSPHMNHTPSPGHQGGVPMVHQMSAQGSNLSGSQGPSTNTSPNVTNKRRRASAIKEEDAAQAAAGDKTKPSPRVGKRQKPA